MCISPYHAGPRWLPVHSFRARSWAGERPLYLHGDCNACHKIAQRARYHRYKHDEDWIDHRREQQRLYTYFKRRADGVPELPLQIKEKRTPESLKRLERKQRKVSRDPIANFIQGLIDDGCTIKQIADAVGVDQARMRVILSGKFNKGGKVYESNFVTLGFADRVMVAVGGNYTIYDLYPELQE